MVVYSRERDWFDILEVHLHIPFIGIRKRTHNPFSVNRVYGTEYGFKLQNECTFFREKNLYWQFKLKFFGFGFEIFRQYNY